MNVDILCKSVGVEYRCINDYPGYAIGNDGSIWSKHIRHGSGGIGNSWSELKAAFDKDGYRRIELRNGWISKRFGIAALVLTVFVGPRPKNMLATHKNGVRHDDRLENLRWATSKENCADKKIHGTNRSVFGENHPFAKLTNGIVLKIRELASNGVSTMKICEQLKISRTQVRRIVTRKRWSHI